ncbi:hypothetical protein [Rhodalgimonas zhirmunskyi]|uniref:Uncharacterized protein n=1 Tax=Rhodalgimonas zhirmunskyi TaxID=2964767 RepID=A0AAJ1X621_9RHOB|nr:hypothetical protein [Rhodoalgimonas zhirmunskyi]MDQ2092977.1 hypothetical protein [Rhodoalgimonas zhirmunskyi]
MTVLTGDDVVWIGDGWYAQNNTWNRRDLINGADYSQSITLSDDVFPQGVSMSWDWPEVANDAFV